MSFICFTLANISLRFVEDYGFLCLSPSLIFATTFANQDLLRGFGELLGVGCPILTVCKSLKAFVEPSIPKLMALNHEEDILIVEAFIISSSKRMDRSFSLSIEWKET